jgi:hypothetical protein
MAALQGVRGKAQAHAPISFLPKKFKPLGACSGYSIASLFLPVSAIRRGPRPWPSSSNHIGGVMDEVHRGLS